MGSENEMTREVICQSGCRPYDRTYIACDSMQELYLNIESVSTHLFPESSEIFDFLFIVIEPSLKLLLAIRFAEILLKSKVVVHLEDCFVLFGYVKANRFHNNIFYMFYQRPRLSYLG